MWIDAFDGFPGRQGFIHADPGFIMKELPV